MDMTNTAVKFDDGILTVTGNYKLSHLHHTKRAKLREVYVTNGCLIIPSITTGYPVLEKIEVSNDDQSVLGLAIADHALEGLQTLTTIKAYNCAVEFGVSACRNSGLKILLLIAVRRAIFSNSSFRQCKIERLSFQFENENEEKPIEFQPFSFAENHSLKDIRIDGNTISSVVRFSPYSFHDCSAVETVYYYNWCCELNPSCLSNCKSLRYVKYNDFCGMQNDSSIYDYLAPAKDVDYLGSVGHLRTRIGVA